MPTKVTLILEYDMCDYSEWEKLLAEDGQSFPTGPEDFEESFYQSDVLLEDLKIVGVRIERS